ncbi:MAG TPA: FAD-dependent oxidoreductase [Candidatus Limnocylindria bacterium]|nr:FAD-dependent oxidoreductase [Candidatus Limnocylindria bacterium]
MARVAVLGGGFGGIATAVALRDQLAADDEVVLVDRRDEFVMGIRKTWHLLGMSPLAYGTRHLAQLEQRGIRFMQGEITDLDEASLTATIDGEPITADALVLALGAAHDMAAVPGLAEHGLNVWSRDGLEHAHQAVDAFRGGRVVVGIFGMPHSCPPAPYELALLLADRFEERGIDAEVSIFTPAPISLPIVGAAGCAPLDARLAERGIGFLPGHVATAVERGTVRCENGSEIPFDLLLAVPRHRVPQVLVDAGLAGAEGWARVERDTLETGHPGIWAIGDCTAIPLANGMALPKAGLFAQLAGEAVAARIAAQLRGEPPMARFDGRGACFLEMGSGEASMIRGDFFGDPPVVELTAPSHDQREEKERFEAERLAAWFGG